MAAFAGYCQAYARWKEAEEFITQHGTIVRTPSGYWQQVPQVSIAQTYLKVMNRFAEQFGLRLHPVAGSLRTAATLVLPMTWRNYSEAMTE
jgi:P27 family predicted phage terminase small subunit